jgi:hypothetical protein
VFQDGQRVISTGVQPDACGLEVPARQTMEAVFQYGGIERWGIRIDRDGVGGQVHGQPLVNQPFKVGDEVLIQFAQVGPGTLDRIPAEFKRGIRDDLFREYQATGRAAGVVSRAVRDGGCATAYHGK